jgi:hypothetical protein
MRLPQGLVPDALSRRLLAQLGVTSLVSCGKAGLRDPGRGE